MSCSNAWKHTALCLALVVSSASAGAAPDATGKGKFRSAWIDIRIGTLVGERGGQPEMLIALTATQPREVWVRMTARMPEAETCERVKRVAQPSHTEFRCPLARLLPDTPYPISFAIFGDEAAQVPLEETGTVMRFAKKDVAAFLDFMKPPALPVTFENVSYADKLGVGTALFGGVKKPGTLTARLEGIRYADMKTMLEIPASAMRKVRMHQVTPKDRWVVVEYDGASGPMIAAFQGSAFKGSTRVEDVYDVLSYVMEQALEAR